MKSILDIRQLLKRYGTYIYTGDKIGDLEMMEDEVRELYHSGVLDAQSFGTAIMLLKQEISKQK
ncbi:YqgQ family protein [Sutcliffiella sp. NPDC057660]|uniref:YqgQ family protein n=1 Tax=Sutcliffiella sp. NPDC057660 TaxID=3346199 RepID=UPI00367D4147